MPAAVVDTGGGTAAGEDPRARLEGHDVLRDDVPRLSSCCRFEVLQLGRSVDVRQTFSHTAAMRGPLRLLNERCADGQTGHAEQKTRGVRGDAVQLRVQSKYNSLHWHVLRGSLPEAKRLLADGFFTR
jgi:hypothetical protein